MNTHEQRICKVEESLSPKQTFLLWFAEGMQNSESHTEFLEWSKNQPCGSWPEEQMFMRWKKEHPGDLSLLAPEKGESLRRALETQANVTTELYLLASEISDMTRQSCDWNLSQLILANSMIGRILHELKKHKGRIPFLNCAGGPDLTDWDVQCDQLAKHLSACKDVLVACQREYYSLTGAISEMRSKYFDGQPVLFKDTSTSIATIQRLLDDHIPIYHRILDWHDVHSPRWARANLDPIWRTLPRVDQYHISPTPDVSSGVREKVKQIVESVRVFYSLLKHHVRN